MRLCAGRKSRPSALLFAALTCVPTGALGQQQPSRTLAERFNETRSEYESRRKAGGRDLSVEDLYCRRMVELAASDLSDPAARDALLWVIDKPGRPDAGAYGDEFARAAALLVRHFGDDPEAVRIGLTLHPVVTHRRDALLYGFYAAARGREAKGLARLALAEYLAHRAGEIDYARSKQGRPKFRTLSGGKVVRESDLTDEQYADHLQLRLGDAAATRAEVERLYEEVIDAYGDLPYITRRRRLLESSLAQPEPEINGRRLTAEDRRRVEQSLARKKTLGEVAEARLDELHNLTVGMPAPEIDGTDVGGGPLKLSGFRGKVVVLVFWGTWCGPCMAQVPHERAMAERLKGRPFALLGVDCRDDRERARAVMDRERMNWPNWYDGADGRGPIAERYHIRRFPSIFVLDGEGVIRARDVQGEKLDEVVDRLLGAQDSNKG